MNLLHLLVSFATALSLVQAADYSQRASVMIFALDSVKTDVVVTAKQESEGQIRDMTAASEFPTFGTWCKSPPPLDPVTGKCAEPEWAAIAIIHFDRPTTKPREVTVTFPDHTIKCTFALNQAMDGRLAVWDIHKAWGLDGRKEDFEIVCDDPTAFTDVYGST